MIQQNLQSSLFPVFVFPRAAANADVDVTSVHLFSLKRSPWTKQVFRLSKLQAVHPNLTKWKDTLNLSHLLKSMISNTSPSYPQR